jgi:hypothetical protein
MEVDGLLSKFLSDSVFVGLWDDKTIVRIIERDRNQIAYDNSTGNQQIICPPFEVHQQFL